MTNLNAEKNIGKKIHALAKKLWPINRSITGNGVRRTLRLLKEICPKISKVYFLGRVRGSSSRDFFVLRVISKFLSFLPCPPGQQCCAALGKAVQCCAVPDQNVLPGS